LKKLRFLALAVLSVMLWSGAAAASISSHYTAMVTTPDNRIFAIRAYSEPIFVEPWRVWHTSEIVEVDAELNVLRELPLTDGTNVARHSLHLAYHDGKLYIGSIGGAMGAETGDVWEVDIVNWTSHRIFNLAPGKGIYGLDIANDGTVFLLIGTYISTWPADFSGELHVTTAAELPNVMSGTGAPITPLVDGFSWNIAWSEFDETLWVMAGSELQAFGKNGAHIETFTPLQLGGNIYSIAPLEGGGLVYTVSDFSSASIGFINAGLEVSSNLVTNLGGQFGDAFVFAFRDQLGRDRVLLSEYVGGPNDFISIYDPSDFSQPIINTSSWEGANFRTVITLGNFLYYGTFEDYNPADPTTQLSGIIGRVDMGTWPGSGAGGGSGGGGGCNGGFGLFAILLVAGFSLLKTRRK